MFFEKNAKRVFTNDPSRDTFVFKSTSLSPVPDNQVFCNVLQQKSKMIKVHGVTSLSPSFSALLRQLEEIFRNMKLVIAACCIISTTLLYSSAVSSSFTILNSVGEGKKRVLGILNRILIRTIVKLLSL